MTEYLQFRSSNCKHCYKCIRLCPVKAISFTADRALIKPEECVLCGNCYAICPQNAKTIRSDIERVKSLIASNRKVVVSLAPAYLAAFNGAHIEGMERMLQKLGFHSVRETAEAATVIKSAYDLMVGSADRSVIISTCCHSVNVMVQKHYPQALPFLAEILSPMLAHGKMIKDEDPEAKVVFIGPCISKKEEAELYPGMIDCVLTFEEILDYMQERGVSLEEDIGIEKGGRARLFPIPGGILRTMDADSDRYDYFAVDGLDSCAAVLRDVLTGRISNCFIEMSACRGGCVSGPAIKRKVMRPLSDYLSVTRNTGREHFRVDPIPIKELSKSFPFNGVADARISDDKIEEVLRKMGKTKPEDELNCGSCGYDSCRRKAAAVIKGKAEITMCLPYLMAKTQSFSDNVITYTPYGILVLDEELRIQQINRASCEIFDVEENQVLGKPANELMDTELYQGVIKGDKNIYEHLTQMERGRYLTQTIIRDKNNHILIGILRDVTEIESARRERASIQRATAEVTNKVIEKQMRTVQEIASLLGETTAETQVALTNLKETISDV